MQLLRAVEAEPDARAHDRRRAAHARGARDRAHDGFPLDDSDASPVPRRPRRHRHHVATRQRDHGVRVTPSCVARNRDLIPVARATATGRARRRTASSLSLDGLPRRPPRATPQRGCFRASRHPIARHRRRLAPPHRPLPWRRYPRRWRARRSRRTSTSMPRSLARACTNAAIGPLPSPITVRCSPSTRTCAVIAAPSSLVVTSCESSWSRGSSGRYSSWNASHISDGRDLGAGVLGDVLDRLRELDLEAAGKVEAVLGLHDVGDAALAGLAVDADDGLVGAADVLRVDRQVGHLPLS